MVSAMGKWIYVIPFPHEQIFHQPPDAIFQPPDATFSTSWCHFFNFSGMSILWIGSASMGFSKSLVFDSWFGKTHTSTSSSQDWPIPEQFILRPYGKKCIVIHHVNLIIEHNVSVFGQSYEEEVLGWGFPNKTMLAYYFQWYAGILNGSPMDLELALHPYFFSFFIHHLTLFQLSSGMTLPTKGGHYGPEQNQGS